MRRAELGAPRGDFRGALFLPCEEGYDDARRVWNGAIDRRPALVMRCAGADDVARAVRLARDRGLGLTVRGGGHSVAGHAVADGAVMIDLSLMRGVRVDPAARTARVAGGALLGDVDRATQPHGLATPTGLVSHTGVGGLTLGGGLGHLTRTHGLTVDNLLAADVVTADGDRVRASADEHPELFWGLRGGGGNFGVATAFEYRLHPVGPVVLGGPVVWPLAQAPRVLAALDALLRDAPDELGLTFALRLAPAAPFVPAAWVGRPALVVMMHWAGDVAAGARATRPLRALGTPLADAVRPLPFVAMQSALDAGNPHGARYYWRSQRVPALTPPVIDALVAAAESLTSPMSYVAALAVDGAAARVGADATAVGPRGSGYEINLVAAVPAESPDLPRGVNWARRGADALRPHATGAFSHFLNDEGEPGVRLAYGARLGRLAALKRRWDPDNVFRHNANVVPHLEAVA